MLEETVKIKIFEGKIRPVWLALKACGKISFANNIQGRVMTKIYDGNNMKVYLPNGKNEHFQTAGGDREDYVAFELTDGSSVTITPEYETQNLRFDFKVKGKANDLKAIRETVLNFIDYNYGR